MPRYRWLGGMNSNSRLRPKSAKSCGLWGRWTSIADPRQIGSFRNHECLRRVNAGQASSGMALGLKTGSQQRKERQASRLTHAFSPFNRTVAHRSGRASARRVSPVRKKREKLTDLFLVRLTSVFGDLKSLRVLNLGRLCAIPFL